MKIYSRVLTISLFLFLNLSISFAQDSWTWVNPLLNGNKLNTVTFINDTIGFIGGDKGLLMKTTNGGMSWEIQKYSTNENYRRIQFLNNSKGFASTTGDIFCTTDAGTTWFQYSNKYQLYDISFVSDSIIYLTTYFEGNIETPAHSTLYKSIDGGKTYKWIFISGTYDFYSSMYIKDGSELFITVYSANTIVKINLKDESVFAYKVLKKLNKIFFEGSVGYAVGEKGSLYRSISDSIWNLQNSNTTMNLNSISFWDSLNGLIVGDGGTVLRTTDAGLSWSHKLITHSDFYDVCCFGKTNAAAIGNYGSIFITKDGGNSWIKVTSSVTDNNLNKVLYLDKNTVIAAGDSGTLLKSDDSGKTWYSLNSNSSENLNDITSNDGNLIIAGDKGSILLSSADDIKWDTVRSETTRNLNAVKLRNGFAAIAGDSGTILLSENNGQSWKQVNTNITRNLYDIEIFQDTIYVLGDSLYRSTDRGKNFFAIFNFQHSHNMKFLNPMQGYVQASGSGSVTWDNGLWMTEDGGTTWKYLSFSASYLLGDVEVVDSSKIFIAGNEGKLFSGNYQSNWINYYVTTNNLNSINFYNAGNGITVGDGGTILKYSSNTSELPGLDTRVPWEFKLSQNYPNPFNPFTTIKYSLSEQSYIELSIYNVLGEKIQSLVNEEKERGDYELHFNPVNLSTGVYYYQLKTKNHILSKKMLLIK